MTKNVVSADKAPSPTEDLVSSESLVSLETQGFDQDAYASQFKQMDKEALATLIAAVVITAVFWLTIALTHDIRATFLTMPLWFVLSCIGGYVFSVVVVVVLIKKFMRDLQLKVSSIKENSTQEASIKAPTSAQSKD